jgi:transposase
VHCTSKNGHCKTAPNGHGIINWTQRKEKKVVWFMKRATYDRQFKLAAVKLVLDENMTVVKAAHELLVHTNTLHRWVKEYQEYGESAFPGHGSALFNSEYEIKKLKRENTQLKSVVDMLKNSGLSRRKGVRPISIFEIKSKSVWLNCRM